jgi:hypothetical protein
MNEYFDKMFLFMDPVTVFSRKIMRIPVNIKIDFYNNIENKFDNNKINKS